MKISFNYKDIVNDIAGKRTDVKYISEEERHSLQDYLYNMAIDLDTRCRKHGIRLILGGGNLLGAVRHGGFIPWDDDLDFMVSREDYEKIKNIFDDEFQDKYELRCPNSKYPNGNRFMQIYRKGTVLRTPGGGNPVQPQCVYIDIFPLDHIPENRIYRTLKGIHANFLMFVGSCVMSSKYGGSNKQFYKLSPRGALFLRARSVVGKLFSYHSPFYWFDRVDKSVQYKRKTSLVGSAVGTRHYFGIIFPYEKVYPLKEIRFIDYMFYAPADIHYYLREAYGDDYMTPPPVNSRESHFAIEFKPD